ncbi:hypothetical protein [Flavobacterium sp. UBA7682]|uniref:hypothetical protein n=1 Tax=Flavobacterium sp. UBA7682 TaxID=1946560 RepID=UPI0025BDB5B7|nr:hypothetical protein [Flavobacterium sp. UBA7682]
MKNGLKLFMLLLYTLACQSQSVINYRNIDDIEGLSSVRFNKEFLKACTLKSKVQQYESFQKESKSSIKVIDKKRDNYIEMRSNPDMGYFEFDERISNSEEVNYLFNDSVLSSITIRNELYFRYIDLDIPLSINSFYHYHKNGNLMFAGFSLQSSITKNIRINMSRIYNAKGKLIKKINHEKHFKLKFSDVIKIGYNNLRLDEKEEMYISRSFNEKEAYWIIEFQLPDDNFANKYIVINDKTKEMNTAVYDRDVEKFRFKEYQEDLNNIKKYLNIDAEP